MTKQINAWTKIWKLPRVLKDILPLKAAVRIKRPALDCSKNEEGKMIENSTSTE